MDSHVIVNNWLTSKITLGRGVRQQCPLSPMLYDLCAEPLEAAIRNNPRMEGINIPAVNSSRRSVKVIAYADDTTFFITNEEGFNALDEVLTMYQEASSARPNRSKSHGLWLGQWKQRQDRPLDIALSNKHTTVLGVTFHPDYTATVSSNFKCMRKRDLSIAGRATVISTFDLSKVYYTARVFTMPYHYFQELDQILWRFLSR